ncbi:PREDICTED: lysine-rich arabinogalactan protein 19-like [Cercocebus atys]|uniref:lysine-rich arabinogalactan protein 19-like n=1 Tax=Cercocebus atys TaxID=9531 RepID=UPI0005F514DE|nr:PREDICTED: lysine-rich arabinogalactan protein 19-like [Cercocebus atys]
MGSAGGKKDSTEKPARGCQYGAALRRKSAAWLPGDAAQVSAAWTTAGPTALDSQSLGLAAHWAPFTRAEAPAVSGRYLSHPQPPTLPTQAYSRSGSLLEAPALSMYPPNGAPTTPTDTRLSPHPAPRAPTPPEPAPLS